MANLDESGGRRTLRESLANGGGVLTYRIALGAMAAISLALVNFFGSRIVDQLDGIGKAQGRMSNSFATLSQKAEDTARITMKNSDRIDDHEHRITILEAHAPSR
jgi:hypothetical protein